MYIYIVRVSAEKCNESVGQLDTPEVSGGRQAQKLWLVAGLSMQMHVFFVQVSYKALCKELEWEKETFQEV